MNYISIDRIEGELAVCEDDSRSKREIPLCALPPGCRPGDVLRAQGEGYQIDQEETARRRERAAALQKKLFRRK